MYCRRTWVAAEFADLCTFSTIWAPLFPTSSCVYRSGGRGFFGTEVQPLLPPHRELSRDGELRASP
jgi:hypothetical protein